MRFVFFLMVLAISPTFAATYIPFERDLPRIEKCAFTASRNDESSFYRTLYCGAADETLYIKSRMIHNVGPNDIIDNIPEGFEYPNRSWEFVTGDSSRRDTWLWISDDPGTGRTSDFMESAVMLLPRTYRTHIAMSGDELVVTLTTGEVVRFHKKYKTITEGILREEPLDTNPDRDARNFARFTYEGSGVILRSNARGADPRLAKFVLVTRPGLPDCRVPASVFWTQEDWPKFRFVRDEDAYVAIITHCGSEYVPR